MRIGIAAFIGVVALTAVSCGSSITNPSSNTNTVLTGVIQPAVNGVGQSPLAGTFPVTSNGFTTITFNSITPTFSLFTTVGITLTTADATGVCQTIINQTSFSTNGVTTTVGSLPLVVLNNLTLVQGSYCILVSDVQGKFTVPESFTMTVNHP